MMNKGREGKSSAPSTDLLVCFPSRTHLRLMPKPICSPVRPSEPNKRGHHHNNHHQRKRSISRSGGSFSGGGQAGSPMLWAKNKSNMGSENSEPTSPKVTCAGQIKVKHKNSACRNWQSVMEEIEKIHNNKKQKKRINWAESLGFKKEIMQFFTCLRAVRFDLRCFGSFSGTDIATEDDDDEEDEEGEDEVYYENDHVDVEESHDEDSEESRTVFSKWFMVLQDEQNNEADKHKEDEKKEENGDGEIAVPPPNALLLMRCRSAPAKSWLKENEEEGGNNNEKEENSQKEKEKEKEKELAQTHVKKGQSLKSLMEEEERNNTKENLVVMRYNSDYYGISTDIATETWIVGGLTDPMSRSRSWKR